MFSFFTIVYISHYHTHTHIYIHPYTQYASNCSNIMARLIHRYLDPECYKVTGVCVCVCVCVCMVSGNMDNGEHYNHTHTLSAQRATVTTPRAC
jgi:hypothetical protein